jgi:RNA polymerase sigma-70 factor (ECF subfamily)
MTEEDIIAGIRSGGRAADAALKALYGATAQHMLRFFVYSGVSADESKDVLQDTFVKIVRSAASYQGGGAARSWIWQIARNCLTDHQRKIGRLAEHETAVNEAQWDSIQEGTAAPESCQPGQTADECVAAGLETFALHMPDRAQVLLLVMDGISLADIGERIGRTAAATKTFVFECRKKLKPFVAHCAELLHA